MKTTNSTCEEVICLKNINKYIDLMRKSVARIDSCEKKISEYSTSFMEINFDIEVIEDPISRPLGSGQENKRVELLIRQLESRVKILESKVHDKQCEIIKHQILVDQYESKINLEQNCLARLIRDFRKKIEPNIALKGFNENAQKL